MSRGSRTERQRGGALLEILVAMAVFAVVGVIAFRGLETVASGKRHLDREIRRWRELALVFERLEGDLLQALPLPLPLPFAGQALAAPLRGGALSGQGNPGFFIELARGDGDRAPLHVRYRCENGELRLVLAAVNGQVGAKSAGPPPATLLLQGVEACEAAFLGAGNLWLGEWPGGQPPARPRAVRLRLTLAGQGRFERLYYLP